ncbi:hypothetical protein FQR65_LT19924 [Abscondita terminalis]|nr:hypothetical protein FQR65_LT19924 [Abscondita terminalis]
MLKWRGAKGLAHIGVLKVLEENGVKVELYSGYKYESVRGILDKGILPQSILASGAFPSLYSPVEIDGKLLIDGGVANNYPIDELRKMGAEIVIGVDVQDGLKNREDIRGASDILLQISNFSMRGVIFIKKGIEAAAPFTEEFKKMGSPEYINNPPSFREKYKGDLCISRVEINEMENFTSSYVYGKLKFTPNTTLTFDNFSTGINNMNGTQNFSSIVYSFAEEDGGDVLKLNLKEAKTQRYLKFGLHFDNLYKSAALVNVTQKKLLFKNDVISLDLGVGDQFRYNLNYYVDNGYRWSVGFQLSSTKISRNIQSSITATL